MSRIKNTRYKIIVFVMIVNILSLFILSLGIFFAFLESDPDGEEKGFSNLKETQKEWSWQYLSKNLLHILFFIFCFSIVAFLYVRPNNRIHWESSAPFFTFFTLFFLEMFGVFFLIYLYSPYAIFVDRYVKHFFFFSQSVHRLGGILISAFGIGIVYLGWGKIHGAEHLVTEGIYSKIRHPQYAGFFIIALGWLFNAPSPVLVTLFPIFVMLYFALSLLEEKHLLEKYGDQYVEYAESVPRYFPWKLSSFNTGKSTKKK